MDFSIDLDNEYINTVLDQWMNEEGDNFMRDKPLFEGLPLPELDSKDIDEILGLDTKDFDQIMETEATGTETYQPPTQDPYDPNQIQDFAPQDFAPQADTPYIVPQQEQELHVLSSQDNTIIQMEAPRAYDNFGFLPRYQERKVERGATEDTFFGNPLYKNMCDNKSVINIVSNGKDEDILALSNFAIQTPGVKPKCDQALESKLHVDATFALITKYNVTDQVCIYKRLAMLSDRVCLGCKTQRLKMVCLAGKFRCHHCTNNGRDVPFDYGFHQWLVNGCLSRHTSVV